MTLLLNYPFHEFLVRTPHAPYPAMLLLPLLMLKTLGLISVSLAIWGLRPAWKERRRETVMHLTWCLVTYGFWAFLENWHPGREAILMVLLPSMLFFVACALKALTTITGTRHLIPRVVVISLLVAGLTRLCFYLDFPSDPRWYDSHRTAPGVQAAGPVSMSAFREPPEEYFRARQDMTSLSLLPAHLGLWKALRRDAHVYSDELLRKDLPENPWWDLNAASSGGGTTPLEAGHHHDPSQNASDQPTGP